MAFMPIYSFIIMNFRSIFHIRLQNFELQAERMLDAALKSRAVAIIQLYLPIIPMERLWRCLPKHGRRDFAKA